MSRRALGGFNRPVYRRGLAGLGDARVFPLTPEQVTAFLARNSAVRSRVTMFEQQVAAGGYDGQRVQDSLGNSGYAIPEYGIAVSDSLLGNVTIFPDAAGVLRYTGNVSDQVTTQTNLPPYTPPPQPGALDGWATMLSYAPWVVGGILALSLFNALPRRRG